MFKKVLAASAVVAGVASNSSLLYEDYSFEAYLQEFGKKYEAPDHYAKRETIFKQNLELVKRHNAEYNAGKHTWWAAMNHLADWTDEEFQTLRSKKYSPSQHPVVDLTDKSKANPDSIDWREKGAVTPVKNQGACGSCWAFAATETMESMYQIATGKQIELSPQTYVNCVKNPNQCGGVGGCEGATMELAYNLTAQTGIATAADMPYTQRDGTCKPYKAAAKCKGYVKNPENNAMGLETAVATKGPQSITVAAGSWQLYGGGIFHGCSHGFLGHQDNTLDHGVQAVGYTKDYWIVRNSWGPSWGLSGYIHVSRASDSKTFTDKNPTDGIACKPIPKTQTVGGECGILFDTSYPIGVTAGDADEVIV